MNNAAYNAGYKWVFDSAYQPMDYTESQYDITKYRGFENDWHNGRKDALNDIEQKRPRRMGGRRTRKRITRKSKRRKSYKRRR